MASKKEKFIPDADKVYQLKPIAEDDYDYGFALMDAYLHTFNIRAIGTMFEHGVIGFVLGSGSLGSKEMLDQLLSSGMYSRPEDWEGKESPHISGGQYIKNKVIRRSLPNLRWYEKVRFQGDLAKLCHADWPNEGRGSMSVTLLNNLAIQGFVPRKKNNEEGIILDSAKIAVMSPDDEHDKPWYAVEFDLFVHRDCASYIPLPHDSKTGYVPLDFIEDCVKEQYG